MPLLDSPTSEARRGRRSVGVAGIALALVLLGVTATWPGTGLTDHEASHSGQCFPPTSDDPETDPLLGWTIAIDPGHGGDDPGAIAHGLDEAVLVLDISDRLRELLRDAGAEVCQTRTEHEHLTRAERAEFANRNDADVLVSIHLNSFEDQDVNYTMTMWHSRADQRLAQDVLESLQARLTSPAEDGEGPLLVDGRHTQFNSGMLRDARMPAILVEAAFLSNPREAAALEDGDRREQIAGAVYDGIVAYVTADRPLLVRATAPVAATAHRGMHRLRTWVRDSSLWKTGQITTGLLAGFGQP